MRKQKKLRNLVEDPPADTVPDQGRRPEKIINGGCTNDDGDDSDDDDGDDNDDDGARGDNGSDCLDNRLDLAHN